MEMQIESACKAFGRTALLAAALAIAVATGGCTGVKEKVSDIGEGIDNVPDQRPATSPPVRPTVQVTPPVQATPPVPSAPKARIEAAAPIPARPLNIHSKCTARDANGYTESIRLAVDQGWVGLLEAKIQIPRRGSCRFHLSDFRQTRTEPHVELRSSTGTMCTVRMWQQGGRFTVAFSECQEKCTRRAFDYVWPMHLKIADGSCL
jgi:hypothetical protein